VAAARGVALSVILIAGVTTFAFNANPLIRLDGYYVLSDLIEVPNLAQR
jgi:putative peptide zinc metalloprotease protein